MLCCEIGGDISCDVVRRGYGVLEGRVLQSLLSGDERGCVCVL